MSPASFLAALTGGAGTEDFESFATGSTAPLLLSFPGAGNAILGGNGQLQGAPNNVGRFAVSGSNYWDANTSFTINFLAPVAAFGFYGVDIGDFNGQLTLTVDGVVSDSVIVVPNSFGLGVNGGGILYFGYVNTDNPFTSITFGNTTAAAGTLGDAFAFDDMTIGSVEQVVRTPEVASTLMLMGMAVGSLSLARRFKA